MKKHASTIILISVFLMGISLLLYPSVSNYWNTRHATRIVRGYIEQSSEEDSGKNLEYIEAAREYNSNILLRYNPFVLTEQEQTQYSELLNVSGTGLMCVIEIPALDVTLPVYHGTDEGVLQVAIGHIDWTSLPVGGESTHCVFSGHRGLPSAELFTDLDKLAVGDDFIITVLGEKLTYQVDQILIVEPHDSQPLKIEEGKDYCTLVTCTPYGVNSHRLLVRGHRVDNAVAEKIVHITADAVQIEPVAVAPIVAAPLLLILLVIMLAPRRRKARK